jgi:hypothetical protein
LLRYLGTGRVHAIIQEENLGAQRLELEGWLGMAVFGAAPRDWSPKDWRHRPASQPAQPDGECGRGLVFQVSQNEFFAVGGGYRLLLRPVLPPRQALDATVSRDHLLVRQAHYVSVEEGHFDAGGAFVVDRRRNGDEVVAAYGWSPTYALCAS